MKLRFAVLVIVTSIMAASLGHGQGTSPHYYPLKLGKNRYLNTVKGALIGVPAGVCANCSVPVACGMTRGKEKAEVALGFLFSSPNFNFVVMTMTFAALPLGMALTKYAILLFVIVIGVPALIRWLERKKSLAVFTPDNGGEYSPIVPSRKEPCEERFLPVLRELGKVYGKNVWRLVKLTVMLMLLASVLSAVLLVLVPWNSLLSSVTPLRMAAASLLSVFMPVPIAADVMFAAQLQHQGIPSGYVMLFLTTLGPYSITPMVYLWREVSRALAISLFGFFVAIGWVVGMLF